MNAIQAMLARAGGLGLAALAVAVAALSAPAGARADTSPVCPSSTADAYPVTALALTGPAATDVTLGFEPAAGCDEVASVRHVQIKIFTADGKIASVKNVRNIPLVDGAATVTLARVERGRRIEADAEIQGSDSPRTFVVRTATTAKLRPDVVVRSIGPAWSLVDEPLAVQAVVEERNGDVGARLHATLMGDLGPLGETAVEVAAGGTAKLTFPSLTPADAVALNLRVELGNAVPGEYDESNDTLAGVVEITKNAVADPFVVLFPSLLGYGAQFNHHLYAPITQTKMPPGGTADVEQKVKDLEPELVRIFYNDNWEENIDGTHPEYQQNYDSFVKVVELAQETGATIEISYQTLANEITKKPPIPIATAMTKFASVLEDLVVNHGLTNVRWAEVGNEPNSGSVTLDQYKTFYQALNDELVTRGLRSHIQLMGGGLVENGGNLARDHYAWLTWIAQNMGNLVDGYAEHVYWQYNDPGRLEYRLRDIYNLATKVVPVEQQKPMYMMEYGVRGDGACGTKPAAQNTYYGADSTNCPEIWRTNIAGFQQLWFDIDSAQLGVAGTSKWDAFWATYDRTVNPPQVYWMTGPAGEGYPLTPTYNALSLLFHTTVPGWRIVQVAPWDDSDWTVPHFHANVGDTSNDQPEQELVAYAGPSGELTVVGLDTHGVALNGVSPDPPSVYSIAGLPADAAFTLAVWNASGDGTNSIVGTVTTNAAGVARFEVPLQAAFALTNVPVE